jgi:hypothetical protein
MLYWHLHLFPVTKKVQVQPVATEWTIDILAEHLSG